GDIGHVLMCLLCLWAEFLTIEIPPLRPAQGLDKENSVPILALLLYLLAGYNFSMRVALGVTGGIAAYKAAELVRLLQDRGIRVQVVMTRAAQEFVRPLTFAALSGEKVITDLFGSGAEEPNIDSAVEHIAVAQSIDALVVVPATADVLAKFAQGLATDF